ncbi:hypothetical protein [Stratiformator vulcanicus]|uniref:Uncharacterized protein n=1 Tax=Stratiformator vulcanicus TaxID=2527980 RepID=A0A517QWA9_9PLAN|nr:hypothetical protein [Stratiformator vulcanicus]QDT35884.1 hypothetical protein Pan189_02370 [Stratiformator vulcanicus]
MSMHSSHGIRAVAVALMISAGASFYAASSEAGGYYYAAPSYYYGPPVVVQRFYAPPVTYAPAFSYYEPYVPVAAYRPPVYEPLPTVTRFSPRRYTEKYYGPYGKYEVNYRFKNGYVEVDIDD